MSFKKIADTSFKFRLTYINPKRQNKFSASGFLKFAKETMKYLQLTLTSRTLQTHEKWKTVAIVIFNDSDCSWEKLDKNHSEKIILRINESTLQVAYTFVTNKNICSIPTLLYCSVSCGSS